MAEQTNGQYFYGDGIEDKEDAAPWIADYLEGHLENTYFNTSNFEAKKYVRVQKYDSVDCLNGGNQNWWQMKFKLEKKDGHADKKLDCVVSDLS